MSILARRHLRLPLFATLGSFLFLLIFMGSTSPIDTVSYAIVFFVGFLAFLVSLGHLLVTLQVGLVSAKNRYRIFIISFIVLVAAMLRSAQSFNWVDVVVVALIAFGLLFYSSRRA